MELTITIPEIGEKQFEPGITPAEILRTIENKLLSLKSIAAEFNGKMIDLKTPLKEDGELIYHSFETEKGKEVYWHSAAHIMAEAVKELYPQVKVTIGPAIDEGFYYDFDKNEPFSEEELAAIETKMKELIKSKLPFERKELSHQEAIDFFKGLEEDYKIELINEMPDNEKISVYTHNKFSDLCRGPHIPYPAKIKAVKLLKSSGAYWRGDENNKMLYRIYGIAYPNKKELREYLTELEERKKRDHRRLGKELDLYSINDDIGPGLVLWHPKGALIRHLIESYWKEEHLNAGYDLINTPHIGKAELWKTSGHIDFYNESMFAPIEVEGNEYYLKPMNCPFHIAVYNSSKHSYRELPVRYAELGTVYRYERSGVLHGLMRVRGFTQDDAHIICTKEQLYEEVENLLIFSIRLLKHFGFEDLQLYLATKPEKCVGECEAWDAASESLETALKNQNMHYEIDEGGGAFYGPKIDIKIKDALSRSWQCTTIQFDFNLPDRFGMEYTGADNKSHRPYMVHRALLGSLERFFGTLIEYHGGDFPFWLTPVQVMLIPVSDATAHYAERVRSKLRKAGFRAEADLRSEKVGYKIREAELKKIPYMAIVGPREEEENTVSLRKRKEGDLGSFSFNETIYKLSRQ